MKLAFVRSSFHEFPESAVYVRLDEISLSSQTVASTGNDDFKRVKVTHQRFQAGCRVMCVIEKMKDEKWAQHFYW